MLPWTPKPQDPVGKGCLYSIPGRRQRFLEPRGQGSANFPQRGLACVEPAARTQSWVWADTELFRFLFYFIYFFFSGPCLISPRTSKPAPPPPQPSAKPTGRLAKGDTHQFFGENVSLLLPLINLEFSRQRFTPSSKAWLMPGSFTL